MREYFSHDSNAKNDEKILELRAELGWEGYGLYWAIVENLREARGYRLRTNYKAIAMSLGVQEDIIEKIICNFDLFEFEYDYKDYDDPLSSIQYFYSPSLQARMQEAALKSELRAEAGRKGAEARWRDKENGPTMAQNGIAIDLPMASHGNKIKVKEKEKEKKNENVVVVSNDTSVEDETKGVSFYSLPQEEQNNEQQQFYKIFFFKNFSNPRGEVTKFIDHNEKFAWIPRGREEPLDTPDKRIAWAHGWTVKTKPRIERLDFIDVWKQIYLKCEACNPEIANLMLNEKITTGKIPKGRHYIRCPEPVWRWIEEHKGEIYPLLIGLYGPENWSYYTL